MSKVDNGELSKKVYLRKLVMPEEANVLDLFCGSGKMYKSCYSESKKYVGVDIKGGHHYATCYKSDNKQFLKEHGCDGFNFVDIDAYGSPLWHLGNVLNMTDQDRISIACTDGQPLNMKRGGKLPRIISSSEGVDKNFQPVGAFYFYDDIFKRFLCQMAIKNRFIIKQYNASWKKGKAVLYSSFILERI